MNKADNLKVSKGDLITADRWNRLAERLPAPSQGTGFNGAIGGRVAFNILNDTAAGGGDGQDLTRGDIVALYNYAGPTKVEDISLGEMLYNARLPEWPNILSTLAVVDESIPLGEAGRVIVSGLAVVKVKEQHSSPYLQSDPQSPQNAIGTTGGFARAIESFIDVRTSQWYSIAFVGDAQNVWRYQTKENITSLPGSHAMNLLALDSDDIYTEIEGLNVVFRDGPGNLCLPKGFRGFCVQVGDVFYGLTTSSALVGDVCAYICSNCDPYSVPVDDCCDPDEQICPDDQTSQPVTGATIAISGFPTCSAPDVAGDLSELNGEYEVPLEPLGGTQIVEFFVPLSSPYKWGLAETDTYDRLRIEAAFSCADPQQDATFTGVSVNWQFLNQGFYENLGTPFLILNTFFNGPVASGNFSTCVNETTGAITEQTITLTATYKKQGQQAAAVQSRVSTLASRFESRFRQAFGNACACGDAAALLNRYGVDADDEQIDRVVSLLANKHPAQTAKEIRDAVVGFLDAERVVNGNNS